MQVTPLCFYTVVISLTVGVGAAAFAKFTYTRVRTYCVVKGLMHDGCWVCHCIAA